MAEPVSTFSVIVPVFNGAETLEACLTALVGQEYPRERFEIVVVDDGSTDESAAIASRFPVRLIRLPENRGRIEARIRGAKEARFETLVFNDVRVLPGRGLLKAIEARAYEPAIPDVRDYDGSLWGFARFFHLLRCRIYAPFYPPSDARGDYWITEENFDRAPKGTGCFVCSRDRWLASQPDNRGMETSDDTRILRTIVATRPILRFTGVEVRYIQRTSAGSVLPHAFRRGPLFADYYLRPGGRYFRPYLAVWGVIGLASLLAALDSRFGKAAAGLGIAAYAGAVAYLSRRLSDVAVVAVCLPAVAAAFGLGILKWQVRRILGAS
ncbi:MAG: glycosyltransferase family 2 protein [Syntrophaceae bacterium]|nr:glycosyltransferase family 2 protein [Syntrophaceae bacterium]